MKEEALKLADYLEDGVVTKREIDEASSMIRRLVEELEELKHDNEELLKCLTAERKQGEPVAYWDGKHFASKEKSSLANIPLYTTPQTKPLSEKELYEVFDKCYPNNGDGDVVTLVDFAKAIEERHGIK